MMHALVSIACDARPRYHPMPDLCPASDLSHAPARSISIACFQRACNGRATSCSTPHSVCTLCTTLHSGSFDSDGTPLLQLLPPRDAPFFTYALSVGCVARSVSLTHNYVDASNLVAAMQDAITSWEADRPMLRGMRCSVRPHLIVI
jgi:hypothetical protein